jgi:stage II sporulation protein AB (anti-sigma F factor)
MVEKNKMKITFKSKSDNVPFSRVVVGSFVSQLDPNLEQLADIKTAVSEAVTNAVIHAYDDENGDIDISCTLFDDLIEIEISDFGKGIDDLSKARQPFYSTVQSDERSGMGFTLMEMFSDELNVTSQRGVGTQVVIKKSLREIFGDQ